MRKKGMDKLICYLPCHHENRRRTPESKWLGCQPRSVYVSLCFHVKVTLVYMSKGFFFLNRRTSHSLYLLDRNKLSHKFGDKVLQTYPGFTNVSWRAGICSWSIPPESWNFLVRGHALYIDWIRKTPRYFGSLLDFRQTCQSIKGLGFNPAWIR